MAYLITQACNGCGACMRICPVGAIAGEKKGAHVISASVCIECGSCGRVCTAGAIVDPFGLVPQRLKRSQWLAPVFDQKACMACVICLDACPVGCLELGPPEGKDPNGYPRMAALDACLGCGLCRDECPADAVALEGRQVA